MKKRRESMNSVQRLTLPTLEAALDSFRRAYLNHDPDAEADFKKVSMMFLESEVLDEAASELSDSFRKDSRTYGLVRSKVSIAMAQGIVAGWNARGAFDEAPRLAKLYGEPMEEQECGTESDASKGGTDDEK